MYKDFWIKLKKFKTWLHLLYVLFRKGAGYVPVSIVHEENNVFGVYFSVKPTWTINN